MALYLGRDRLDAMFAIKELAGKMSEATLTSLQDLRKLVEFLTHWRLGNQTCSFLLL